MNEQNQSKQELQTKLDGLTRELATLRRDLTVQQDKH